MRLDKVVTMVLEDGSEVTLKDELTWALQGTAFAVAIAGVVAGYRSNKRKKSQNQLDAMFNRVKAVKPNLNIEF